LIQSEKPQPRYAHTATQIHEKMYVFGGQNQSQNFIEKFFIHFIKAKTSMMFGCLILVMARLAG